MPYRVVRNMFIRNMSYHIAGRDLDFYVTHNRTVGTMDISFIFSTSCDFVYRETPYTITLQTNLSH